ncbi:MAG TPA: hypothetical protein VFB06_29535 [Streptosporangiaceae bacterium]|nr:hypothetical protein [Streptosporangiaceae bacterium]
MTRRGGPKCGAKLHGRDGTCSLPAGWGTSHPGYGRCRKHLGGTPNLIRAAEAERVDLEARAELARQDVVPVEDPLTELQNLAGRVLAWERVAGEMVNRLEAVRYRDHRGGEQLRAEVALLERAMDRAAHILIAMVRLNLDERVVRLTERQADLAAEALRGALADLGIDRDGDEVMRALARRLRLADAQERRAIPGSVTDPS